MKSLLVLALLAPVVACAGKLTVTETEEAIVITRGDIPVLTYHKAEVDPPAGVDPVFKRSGFIHPLCAPNGAPVTGIHPTDHYHHFGLWHAWVKTKHGKDKPDFWNLKRRTGRVRYRETLVILKATAEDPAVGFVVAQEHVAYKGKAKKETVVLRELFQVKAEHTEIGNVVRYEVEQENVSDETLRLPAYRYGGGIAYRAPHAWDKTNSSVLTSEGKDRTNGHTTRANWVSFAGPTAKGEASLAILINAENRDFPNRLRIWPPDTHDGAIFLNVVPTQEHPWEIKPGEKFAMAYALVAADGKPDAKTIEGWWKSYAGEKE